MKEWAHKKLNPFKDLHLILLGSGINVAQDIKNKNRKRPIISYLRLYFVIPMQIDGYLKTSNLYIFMPTNAPTFLYYKLFYLLYR